MTAAFLLAQLEDSRAITDRRLAVWQRYHDALLPLEAAGKIRRPVVPEGAQHNGHIYAVLLEDEIQRGRIQQTLREQGISTTSHYVSLHDSPAGKRHGRPHGALAVTTRVSGSLLRLPMFADLSIQEQERVVCALNTAC